MNDQNIQTTYVCRLEALAPVHVGSGETLKKDFDFFIQNGKAHLVSSAKIMTEVAKLGPEKINAFTTAMDGGKAGEWLRQHGIRVKTLARESCPLPGGKDPREIRAQIKDGFGNPYLPGSSIKGALRTAVIRKLFTASNVNLKTQSNDKEICKDVLGKDAKLNLMRCLAVGDFALTKSDQTAVNNTLVYRLDSPGSGKMSPKQIGPPKKKFDMQICIQHFLPAAICSGNISVNNFLSAKDREHDCFKFKAHIDLPWLIHACRELAAHTIETELSFFKDKTGKPVQGIVNFYKALQEKQNQLEDNEIIIQMAWGAGWRGMTGQLLEENDLTPQLRGKLKLASKYKDAFPFPKSRRIVTVNGREMPLGWVKLSFLSKEELRKKEETERQQAIIREQKEKEEREQKAAANAAQALETFRNRVNTCANLPGEIDSLIQQIQTKASSEDRRLMCQALIDKGNALDKKKKFRKALKDGKNWAIKLKNLCEENGIAI